MGPGYGAILLAVLIVALLPLGAVRPAAMAVVHLALCAAALVAVARAPEQLARAGRARAWLIATGPLLGAVAMGLLPLPAALLGAVAPARVEALPVVGWGAASLDPAATLGELATLSATLAAGALVCVWAVHPRRRRAADGAATVALLGLAVFAGLHAALGATRVLGVLAPTSAPHPFFAPLVNPNHLGTLLVIGVPLALGVAADRGRRGVLVARTGAAAAALGVVLLAWIGSAGALLALGAVAAAWAWRRLPGLSARLSGLVGIAAAGAVALAVLTRLDPSWAAWAVPARLSQWGDQGALIAGSPLLGSGGGTYALAYAPLRSWPAYASVEHAHSDWLEWVAETGAVGLVAVVVAATLLVLRLGEPDPRAWKWDLALVGAAVHAAVEFPLQIPGVALVVAAVAAVRFAAYERTLPIAVGTARRWLLALALAQAVAAGWQIREAFVSSAARDVYAFAQDPARADAGAVRLGRLAPGRPEVGLHAAWSALRRGEREAAAEAARAVAAAHPHRAEALRHAGAALLASGHAHDAIAVLERATRRDPNDYRSWAVLSRARAAAMADPLPAAEALAEALRHWPYGASRDGAPLEEGWALLPVGLWWLEAIEDAPNWWNLYLGGQSMRRGDPETALLAYDAAALRDPSLWDWPSRARALAALDRAAEAEALLRARLAREPDHAPTWRALGDRCLADGRAVEARDAYLQALALTPGERGLLVGAVRAAEAADGVDGGRRMGERLALGGSTSPALQVERARLALADGDPRACLRLLRPEVLDDPEVGARAAVLRSRCRAACVTCGDLP